MEHLPQALRLRGAGHQKHHVSRGVDCRGRERHPPGAWLPGLDGHGPLVALVQRGACGEERGRVSILAHAQEDQVEPGERFRGEERTQLALVLGRGLRGRHLAPDAMDVLRRNRRVAQPNIPHHAVVALRVVRGHTPLITPEKVNPRPIHAASHFWPGQPGIQCPWRCAAGEHQAKPLALCQGVACQRDQVFSSRLRDGRRIGIQANISRFHASSCR